MLSKFFKPKWQHTNPVVRVSAVKNFSDDNPDHFRILSQLATSDPDLSVREAAIEQISKPEHLVTLLESAKSPDITGKIETLLANRLNEASDPEAMFHKIIACKNQTAIFNAIAKCQNQHLHQNLLDSARSDQQLSDIALSNAPVNIRKSAAERITDSTVIDQLLKASKQSDKTIHRIMRDKLQQLKDAEKQTQELTERAEQLHAQAKHLATGEWFPLYPAKIEALLQEWSQLPEAIQATLKHTFADSITTCQQRVNEANRAAEEEAAKREAAKIARAAIQQTLQNLTTIVDGVSTLITRTEDEAKNSSEYKAELDAQLSVWNASCQFASEQETKQVQQLQQKFAEIEQCLASMSDSLSRLDSAIERFNHENFAKKPLSEQAKQIKKFLNELNWPKAAVRPLQLQQIDAQLDDLKAQQEKIKQKAQQETAHIKQKIEELEQAIEQGEIKVADKMFRKTADLISKLNGHTPESIEQKFKGLNTRLQELKNWQGYAVQPKKEQLCVELEALAHQDLPAPEKAQLIKQYQQQWKLLDSTDPFHSQALWRRFKAASDKAYEPCEAFFAKQNEARRYNLEQRKLICSEVNNYLQQIDWNVEDWRTIENVIQSAKQEWRRFVPVDRNPGQVLQKEFNQLLQHAEQRFKEAKEASRQTKESLIEKIALLTEAENVIQAAEDAKALQLEWKNAGPTFHSQERKLWLAFRGHCDTIFKRLHEQAPSRESQKSIKQQAQQLTHRLNEFTEKPLAIQSMLDELEEIRNRVTEQPDLLHAKELDKLNQAASSLEDQAEQLTKMLNNSALQEYLRHTELCDQFELAILETPSAPPKSEAFFASWTLTGDSSLNEKMLSRREQIESLSDETSIDELLTQTERHLREICIRLEIALGVASPEQDHMLRMEYQMQRLQQALEQQHTSATLVDIKTLELEWIAVPFHHLDDALNERFGDLIDKVFS